MNAPPFEKEQGMVHFLKQRFWNFMWEMRGKNSNDRVATGRPDDEKFMAAIIPDVLKKLDLKPPDIMLDIGCGGGYFLKAFAKQVSHITATDKTASMVERTKESLRETPNVTVLQCDANRIPREDAFFDKILMYSVLQYFMKDDYILSFFKEIRRLLRPGGKALIADIPDQEKFNVSKMKGRFNWLRIMVSRNACRWFSKEQILNFCREAGLQGTILSQPETLVSHEFRFDLLVQRG